jgi:hypothetical protein
MAEARQSRWRRSVVFETGSRALKSAMDAGDITVLAAFKAARYLSHDEQDTLLAEGTGREFSRRVAELAQEHTGVTTGRQLTTEEWEMVLKMRAERGTRP